jgi:hypothetical protein
MKNLIELLWDVKHGVNCLDIAGDRVLKDRCDTMQILDEAIRELENRPKWETPEQYRERTGKAWPDDWAVYTRAYSSGMSWSRWAVCDYAEAKCTIYTVQTVCATEAGPPPDDWGL